MSASEAILATSGGRSAARRDPRPLLWLISLTCLLVMASHVIPHLGDIASVIPETLMWIVALAIMNMLPVTPWKHIAFVLDSPITVLAMLVLPPSVVAIASLVGAVDPREITRRISPTKAVYNHAQVAMAAFVGSVAAHAVSGDPATSRYIILLAFMARALSAAVNAILVSLGASIASGHSVGGVLRHMLVGHAFDYAITQSLAAVVGGALAILYPHSEVSAVAAALAVCVVSRQALARSQMVIDARRAYRSREQALKQVSQQIHKERSEERQLIAAELHDEVLQPLFKVTLMAQVLKGDLAGGRLLELDQDLPELLTAADLASTTLRELIGDLRRSALGRGGLAPAVTRFLEGASSRAHSVLHVEISQVDVPPELELVLYQIVKEAVTNAITHARAKNIWITLRQLDKLVELVVRDDGIGFDPDMIPSRHYGLEIMRERAAGANAQLWIDAFPEQGTCIRVYIMRQAK